MREEKEIDCCYAIGDKVWVTDPDGNDWELYRRLGDGKRLAPEREKDVHSGTCCSVQA